MLIFTLKIIAGHQEAGLQDQPSAASSQQILFLNLIITNLYLDIHEGINKCDLKICNWLASRISLQRPPGTRHYFDIRIEILTLRKNKSQPPKDPIFVVFSSKFTKNGYIPYESGTLVCLLVIFWSLAYENHIFVVFNELIDVQNTQFTI